MFGFYFIGICYFVLFCFVFFLFHLLKPFLYSLCMHFYLIPKWIYEIEKKTHQNERIKGEKKKPAHTFTTVFYAAYCIFYVHQVLMQSILCLYKMFSRNTFLVWGYIVRFSVGSLLAMIHTIARSAIQLANSLFAHGRVLFARAIRSVHNFSYSFACNLISYRFTSNRCTLLLRILTD